MGAGQGLTLKPALSSSWPRNPQARARRSGWGMGKGRRCHALLALLFLLAACAPAAGSDAPIEATPHPWSAAPELVGSEWVLVELNGAAPLAGSHLTLAFDAEQLTGYAGCNWYGAPYQEVTEAGPPAVLFSLTMRACQEPAGVMEQEQVFIITLQSAAGRRLLGERLEYHDAAGLTVAAFALEVQRDMDPADLVGTRWHLVSLAGAPPLEAPLPTLAFEREGELIGHSGCRDFRATYQAKDDDLNLLFMEMLTPDCPDQARLLQEGEYTTLLSEATSYRLADSELEIYTASGQSLLFAVAP